MSDLSSVKTELASQLGVSHLIDKPFVRSCIPACFRDSGRRCSSLCHCNFHILLLISIQVVHNSCPISTLIRCKDTTFFLIYARIRKEKIRFARYFVGFCRFRYDLGLILPYPVAVFPINGNTYCVGHNFQS